MSRRSRAGALLLLLVAAAGCGGSQSAPAAPDLRELAELERSLWVRSEQLTAACMQAQGFDYQPRRYRGQPAESLAGSPFDLTLTREEASASGFGIVDDLLAETGAADPAGGSRPPPAGDQGQGGSPPENSRSDARAVALLGGGTDDTPGCRAEAEARARAELAADIRAVEGRMVEIGQRIEADPRYQSLWQEWSGCMATSGIEATDLTGLTRGLAREARELIAAGTGAGQARPHQPDRSESAGPDPAAIAQLRAREITAATAAIECLEPLRPRYAEIVADAERSFDD